MYARHSISALAVALLAAACTPDAPSEALEPDLSVNTEQPSFTPFTVAPVLENRDEVVAALQREYPTLLRDAGIGGRASVWFLIADDGHVVNTILNQSSGHEALDQAAMRVADVFRFRPAENDGEAVSVWVSLPITFATS